MICRRRAIALPTSVYTSVLHGRGRMDVTNGLAVGTMAVKQFGAIVILWRGGDFFEPVEPPPDALAPAAR